MAQGLKDSLRRFGLGDIVRGVEMTKGGGGALKTAGDVAGGLAMAKGGGMGAGMAGGAAASATGIGIAVGLAMMAVEVLKSIFDYIKSVWEEFPVVVAIMKLFKLIIMMLFYPLIPLLKPVLQGMAKVFPQLMQMAQALYKMIDQFMAQMGLGTGIENMVKNIISGLYQLYAGFLLFVMLFSVLSKTLNDNVISFFKTMASVLPKIIPIVINALQWLGNWLAKNLQSIWNTITKILSWAGTFLTTYWKTIEKVLNWVGKFLQTSWTDIQKGLDWFKTFISTSFRTVLTAMYNIIKNIVTWLTGLHIGTWHPFSTTVEDAIIKPNGQIIRTSPGDTLMATKGGMGGNVVTVNINNPSVRKDADIKELVRQVSRELQKGLRGYVSYV